MSVCAVEGCDRPIGNRDWCTMHYQRWRKHGDPLLVVKPYNPARPIEAGDRFGRLTVVKSRVPGVEPVECICDCGSQVAVRFDALLNGNTKSCGCSHLRPEGKTKHPLYGVWRAMLDRCHRPGAASYERYGARGITVCDRWREDFWNFLADVGERPPGVKPSGRALYSLDRIDNDGDYEPGNVRWATDEEQANNRRPARSAS